MYSNITKLTALFLFILNVVFYHSARAQVACPPNIDLELGNFTNWNLFIGSNGSYGTMIGQYPGLSGPMAPVANRHVITSGPTTDHYGSFPIVAPGGGTYSMKLGNDGTGSQMEQARYLITVPAGVNNYSLIYRYAVVFENPTHTAAEQPFFRIRAYDATTGVSVNCASFTYVSAGSLPGFITSPFPRVSGVPVYYRDWSTASLNLSGQAGNTLVIEFTSADCSQSGHFGYGYVDMNCGLFNITNSNCYSSTNTPLSAPPGFQTYTWYDGGYTTVLGIGQNITIPTPITTTTYHVVLTPYPGYGCQDTLTTQITTSSLTVTAPADTMLCNDPSVTLNPTIVGNAPPFTYAWTPAAGLSCTSCTNPAATPAANTYYLVSVTDANGCTKTDSVLVKSRATVTPGSILGIACFNGAATGSATMVGGNGTLPFTYSWNTTPVQTTPTATNLGVGTYTVTATDAMGCMATASAVITSPTQLTAAITASSNVNCFSTNTGSATVTPGGGTPPYTYSWTTSPVQTTATANLTSGNFIATVTDSRGCSAATSPVTITQPTQLTATTTKTDALCFNGATGTGTVAATGGTAPYTYSWNTIPVQTTATATALTAGTYTATVTDSKGCTTTSAAIIGQPTVVSGTITNVDVSCNGGANGTATVVGSGGTAPYTAYSWNTIPVQTTATATGLAAGSYTVTITDNKGCTGTANTTIIQPTLLTAITAKSDVGCMNGASGTASVFASGGTTPYSFSWNTTPVQTGITANGLAAGTYTATVTDGHGCTTTASAIITQPAAVTATTTKTDANCFANNDGTATVLAAGGTAPYTYSWNTTPVQTTTTANTLPAGTYTVTVTDNNGCTGTATATIGQPAILAATINKTDVSCFNGTNGTATAVVTGGTAPYTYSWNTTPVQTSATAGTLGIGTYTVTVTDSKGCGTLATVTITQPTVLTATATKTDVNCFAGSSATVTAIPAGGTAPYTYAWNTVPVQTTVTATGLPIGTYNVTVTDSKGCTATASASPVQPTALTAVTTQTNTTCFNGTNGTATVTAANATPPYTYSWNSAPVQTTVTATALPAGTYTATVTDSKGCTTTSTAIIGQPNAVTGTITKTDVSCFGGSNGDATVLPAGGTPGYTYSWNTTPVQTTITATGLAIGNRTVTITDTNGCTGTASILIAQPPVLTATTTKTDLVCYNGFSGTATAIPVGGTAPYTYSWNTIPTLTSGVINSIPAGTFTVTVTDSKGCTTTATATLTQPTQLITSISSSTNVTCNAGTNGAATGIASGATPPYTYSWNTTPVQTTAAATGLIAGSYTLTVTDSKGCISLSNVSITQPTPITTTFTHTDIKCYGTNAGNATVTGSGSNPPYTYSWNTVPVQTTASAINIPAGTFNVTLTDINGCTKVSSVTVTQTPEIIIAVNELQKTCRGTSNGSAEAVVSGGLPPYSYVWNVIPVQTIPVAHNLAAGNYSIKITDAYGCVKMGNGVVNNYPTQKVITDSVKTICRNQSVQLLATGNVAYEWMPPVNLTCIYCDNPIATPPSSTTYTVIGTDNLGCKDTAKVKISVIDRVPPVISPMREVCKGDTANLFVQGGTNYSWTPSATLNDSHVNDPISHTDTTQQYRVIVTQSGCLPDTLYQLVKVYPNPTIQLGPDFRGIPGALVTLPTVTTNAANIAWAPSMGLSCTNCFEPTATLDKTITYVATVSTDFGCTASDDVTIQVFCDGSAFFMANTFTPNGDGQNDIFFPQGRGINTIKRFIVLNRWGETVFSATNIQANNPAYGWDGTFKGSTLQPDVFVYIVEAECGSGEPIHMKGDISLIH